jgi:hypothetical protein
MKRKTKSKNLSLYRREGDPAGANDDRLEKKAEMAVRINKVLATELLEDLKTDENAISLREFISRNFERLSNSGRTIRELYEYFRAGGVESGSYTSFRKAYKLVEAEQKVTGETQTEERNEDGESGETD